MRYIQAIIDYAQKIFEENILIKIVMWLPLFMFNYVQDNTSPMIIKGIFALYCLDFIFGFAVAVKNRKVSSFRFMKGALKLGIYLILLFIGVFSDNVLVSEIWSSLPHIFLPLMYSFIIGTDAISVMENLSNLGFSVPVKYIKYLEVYRDKQEKRIQDSLDIKPEDLATPDK